MLCSARTSAVLGTTDGDGRSAISRASVSASCCAGGRAKEGRGQRGPFRSPTARGSRTRTCCRLVLHSHLEPLAHARDLGRLEPGQPLPILLQHRVDTLGGGLAGARLILERRPGRQRRGLRLVARELDRLGLAQAADRLGQRERRDRRVVRRQERRERVVARDDRDWVGAGGTGARCVSGLDHAGGQESAHDRSAPRRPASLVAGTGLSLRCRGLELWPSVGCCSAGSSGDGWISMTLA